MINKDLPQKIEKSDYLSRLIKKYPQLEIDCADPFAEMDAILTDLKSISKFDDYALVEQALVSAKARFSFYWAIAELSQFGRYSEQGKWQTEFAEITIDLAIKTAWYVVANKNRALLTVIEQQGVPVAGFFVLGMGKLGGYDLNFSSDIDLVAFYQPELLPVPDTLGKSYICHQVLQSASRLLTQNGQSDFIWRVDWRLRPNASSTSLAMSSEAASDYYFYRASPWHRLAMMKARVVAGDYSAGKQFLESLAPFVWRQNLDYRALDELGEIKNKINLEHPGLKVQRQWREPINQEVGGFNLKLGTGGIREIEFIANALQLVWGGKQYQLRTTNTVTALRQLAALSHLDSAVVLELISGYQYLRRLENALQLLSNQQTHLLPVDEKSQLALLELIGEQDWESLVTRLNGCRSTVSKHFEQLFAEQAQAQSLEIEWPNNLSEVAQEVVDGWENGFQQYGVSNQTRRRLKPLVIALAEYLEQLEVSGNRSLKANDAVMRLHHYFLSLPQGEQYFRLLAESPRLLESLIPPLLYSPAMTTLLTQSPHIIDCFMTRDIDVNQTLDSRYVLQAREYETRLERIRRFVNEQLYSNYLAFFQGKVLPAEFSKKLYQLATHTLELAIQVVCDQQQLSESPIAVIGMGKMGTGKMAPLSDMDLIFIFDETETTPEVATKFVSRLQTAISAPMREGVAYELDTRLRPSGKSGAPTLSVESFRKHQLQRAHTWEHIALVASQVIVGSESLTAKINRVKQEVLTRNRDVNQLQKDAIKMWHRIEEHRIRNQDISLMQVKLRPGGLMQAEFLAACLVLMQDNEGQLLEYDALLANASVDPYQRIPKILEFWQTQQCWERLLGHEEQAISAVPKPYLRKLVRQSEVSSIAELLSKQQRYVNYITNWMDALFETEKHDLKSIKAWQESAVKWQV